MDKITPSSIMHQIRDGVRSEKITKSHVNNLNIEEVLGTNSNSDSIQSLMTIQDNIPVSFIDPILTSRYKLIGKILIPFRKLGARLFTKWYFDPFKSEQKYLNREVWNSIQTLRTVSLNNELKMNELIEHNEELKDRIESLESEINKLKNQSVLDFNYAKFASNFAADPKIAKEYFKKYLPYINKDSKIIDLGCGTGPFLELMRESNIDVMGIDSDEDLVELCKTKNFEVEHKNIIDFLIESNDNSLDSLFMAHVIEHFPMKVKIDFFNLVYRKLKKGSKLIIETPNTTSVFVMHNLYYLDPTHQSPLLPEAYKHISVTAGFTVINSFLSDKINDKEDYYNYSLIIEK